MQYCLKYLYIEYFLAVKGLGSLKFLACHTRLYLSCGLVFNVDVMSITLNTNNLVSGPPLQIPFAWLLIFEVYTVSNFEVWIGSRGSLLGG